MEQKSQKIALQILGFLLNLVLFTLSTYILVYPGWRRNDPSGDVIESIYRSQGLWCQCTFYTHGSWQCDDYDRFFIALPGVLQGSRALMILAVIFSFISMWFLLFGARCTTFYRKNINTKHKLSGVTAGLILLSGTFNLISVSWYAAEVTSQYWMDTHVGPSLDTSLWRDRFIWGQCIYLGWVNFMISLIATLSTCCGSRLSEEEQEYIYEMQMHNGQDNLGYHRNEMIDQVENWRENNQNILEKSGLGLPLDNSMINTHMISKGLQKYYRDDPVPFGVAPERFRHVSNGNKSNNNIHNMTHGNNHNHNISPQNYPPKTLIVNNPISQINNQHHPNSMLNNNSNQNHNNPNQISSNISNHLKPQAVSTQNPNHIPMFNPEGSQDNKPSILKNANPALPKNPPVAHKHIHNNSSLKNLSAKQQNAAILNNLFGSNDKQNSNRKVDYI